MPEMATWWRSVVCLAPFIYPTSAGHCSRAAPIPKALAGPHFCLSSEAAVKPGRHPHQAEKSLSRLKLRRLTGAFSNSRFLTDCYSFLPQFQVGRAVAYAECSAPIESAKAEVIVFLTLRASKTFVVNLFKLTFLKSQRPRPGSQSGAAGLDLAVSWPGGEGKPGYRAGRPPPELCTGACGHGGRGHAARLRRAYSEIGSGGPAFGIAERWGAAADAHIAGWPRRPRYRRRRRCRRSVRHGGRDRPRQVAASATCGVSPG